MPTTAMNQEWFSNRVRQLNGPIVWGRRLENRTSRFAEYTVTVTAVPVDPNTPTQSIAAGGYKYGVEIAFGKIAGTQRVSQQTFGNGDVFTSNRNDAIALAENIVSAKTMKRDYVEQHQADVELPDPFDGSFDGQDWSSSVTDDKILGKNDVPPPAEVDNDAACSCFNEAKEQALLWDEPSVATPEVATFLTASGYEMLQYADSKPKDRWLVYANHNCSSGYYHTRAILISKVEKTSLDVEKIKLAVQISLSKRVRSLADVSTKDADEATFALIVEADKNILTVIDALIWNGEGLSGASWLDRRRALEANFEEVFSVTPNGGVRLLPRVSQRLRETYITGNDSHRFELYSESGMIGQDAWVLP